MEKVFFPYVCSSFLQNFPQKGSKSFENKFDGSETQFLNLKRNPIPFYKSALALIVPKTHKIQTRFLHTGICFTVVHFATKKF